MKSVLFDWNGTLLDDMPVFYGAVKEVFRTFSLKPPTIEEYFRGLEGDYLAIYRTRGIMASREELNAIYQSYYESHINEAVLSPGVKKVLEYLVQRGIIIGLVTIQEESLALPLMEKFGIHQLFHYTKFHVLDKKTAIQDILRNTHINPCDCCFVGDSPSDIRQAREAGVRAIAFLNGYIPNDLVMNSQPDIVISNLEEIITMI